MIEIIKKRKLNHKFQEIWKEMEDNIILQMVNTVDKYF